MTTRVSFALLSAILVSVALAQESPLPTASITGENASPAISPEQSVIPSSASAETPSTAPLRSARISFVPPPMEGTISLGIYDRTGKLVRVLHQQAQLNEFAVGADGLVTQWDGRNDNDEDMPAGRYRARGYLVGSLKLERVGESSPGTIENGTNARVKVTLIRNPLRNDKKSVVELGIGFDEDGSYLKTSDELPIFTVSEAPDLARAWIAKNGENAVDVWQDDGKTVRQFRVSNLDKMMAFDCGEFELK